VSSVINTNVMSLNAQRNMLKSSGDLANSMQRLSTGLRINSAKDDSAGLAISERMTGQVRGMNQAVRNANDGISMLQTAEGALGEVTNNLQRIRELAVQAANSTNTDDDKNAINTEIQSLIEEIDRVATGTQFNGKTLISGGGAGNIQVGANDGQVIDVGIISDASTTSLGVIEQPAAGGTRATIVAGSSLSDINVSSTAYTRSDGTEVAASTADAAIQAVDGALTIINNDRARMGAMQSRFESVVTTLQTSSENLSGARSRIRDADFAVETAALTRSQILQQAGTAMLSQANSAPQGVLSLLKG
jgi:flagellin